MSFPTKEEYALIIDLLEAGQNIEVAKLCMEKTGWSLEKAHAWLEGFLTGHYAAVWKT